MILLVHLLFGAAIGSMVNNVPLAMILALLSHYFLDFVPHVDYNIGNLLKKQWHKAKPDIAKIIIDLCFGISLLILFSKSQSIIYVYAFLALVPDGLGLIHNFVPNKLLEMHNKFHPKKVHYFENKKISIFWRLLSQVLVVLISLIILKG